MPYNYYPYGYQQQNMPYQQQFAPQQQVLNGKIVDCIEAARSADVPIGSYGVFPRADMSAVYVKTWNNDGTTRIDEYDKLCEERPKTNDVYAEALDNIQKQLSSLVKLYDASAQRQMRGKGGSDNV